MVIRQLRSFRLEILVGLSSTFLGRVGVMQTGVVLRGLRRTCKVGNRRPDDMIKWLHTKAGWLAASRWHAGQIPLDVPYVVCKVGKSFSDTPPHKEVDTTAGEGLLGKDDDL